MFYTGYLQAVCSSYACAGVFCKYVVTCGFIDIKLEVQAYTYVPITCTSISLMTTWLSLLTLPYFDFLSYNTN